MLTTHKTSLVRGDAGSKEGAPNPARETTLAKGCPTQFLPQGLTYIGQVRPGVDNVILPDMTLHNGGYGIYQGYSVAPGAVGFSLASLYDADLGTVVLTVPTPPSIAGSTWFWTVPLAAANFCQSKVNWTLVDGDQQYHLTLKLGGTVIYDSNKPDGDGTQTVGFKNPSGLALEVRIGIGPTTSPPGTTVTVKVSLKAVGLLGDHPAGFYLVKYCGGGWQAAAEDVNPHRGSVPPAYWVQPHQFGTLRKKGTNREPANYGLLSGGGNIGYVTGDIIQGYTLHDNTQADQLFGICYSNGTKRDFPGSHYENYTNQYPFDRTQHTVISCPISPAAPNPAFGPRYDGNENYPALIVRDHWEATKNYGPGDLMIDDADGHAYLSQTANLNRQPSLNCTGDTSDWQLSNGGAVNAIAPGGLDAGLAGIAGVRMKDGGALSGELDAKGNPLFEYLTATGDEANPSGFAKCSHLWNVIFHDGRGLIMMGCGYNNLPTGYQTDLDWAGGSGGTPPTFAFYRQAVNLLGSGANDSPGTGVRVTMDVAPLPLFLFVQYLKNTFNSAAGTVLDSALHPEALFQNPFPGVGGPFPWTKNDASANRTISTALWVSRTPVSGETHYLSRVTPPASSSFSITAKYYDDVGDEIPSLQATFNFAPQLKTLPTLYGGFGPNSYQLTAIDGYIDFVAGAYGQSILEVGYVIIMGLRLPNSWRYVVYPVVINTGNMATFRTAATIAGHVGANSAEFILFDGTSTGTPSAGPVRVDFNTDGTTLDYGSVGSPFTIGGYPANPAAVGLITRVNGGQLVNGVVMDVPIPNPEAAVKVALDIAFTDGLDSLGTLRWDMALPVPHQFKVGDPVSLKKTPTGAVCLDSGGGSHPQAPFIGTHMTIAALPASGNEWLVSINSSGGVFSGFFIWQFVPA